MTPLRQQMITAMQVRGFSPRTHQAYLQAVQGLAKYYRQPPDRLDQDQISRYLEYLACERQLSASSCRQAFHAIRFLLVQVLKRDELEVAFPVPKRKTGLSPLCINCLPPLMCVSGWPF